MNSSASSENAQKLIEALQAAGAIDVEQKEALMKALSEVSSEPPETVFANARLFNEKQVSSLSRALQLLAAGRITNTHIAIYVMSVLKAGKSLSEALDGLEEMAKQEESTILPAVIQAFKREISEENMQELEKRMRESPHVSWEEHVMALNMLKPKDFEIAKLGQSMIDQGEITQSKFSVALYDYLTGMCSFEESLEVRGWWPSSRVRSVSG